jgi:hypothetical protein
MDSFLKSKALLEFTHNLEDINNESSVSIIKSYSVNGSKQFLEIILDHVWIRTDGKNLKQVIIGAEIESWEDHLFGFKIVFKLLLANLKTFLESSKRVSKQVIGTDFNDILAFSSSFHDFQPLTVDFLEHFGFSWHLLGDITRCKHRHQVGPKGLNL